MSGSNSRERTTTFSAILLTELHGRASLDWRWREADSSGDREAVGTVISLRREKRWTRSSLVLWTRPPPHIATR